MRRQKVLIALSGGVDSSVSAFILKEKGFDLIGVTFVFHQSANPLRNSIHQNANDAAQVAEKLNIPHYVIDYRKDFNDTVISYFIESYRNGLTPNPCAFCNFSMKWDKLLSLANEFSCESVATGHYAVINQQNNRYFISKALDDAKDQGFFLWRLNQEMLKRTIFPLGTYQKTDIKQIAENIGLVRHAKKRESYNLCFIPDGDYRQFINQSFTESELKEGRGNIYLQDGTIIGEHDGIWNYTIGQSIRLNNNNLHVIKTNLEKNDIIVGKKENLLCKHAILEPFNLTKYEDIPFDAKLFAKYNYYLPPVPCQVLIHERQMEIRFMDDVYSLAPGQSIAIYDIDDMIGGGVINLILNT